MAPVNQSGTSIILLSISHFYAVFFIISYDDFIQFISATFYRESRLCNMYNKHYPELILQTIHDIRNDVYLNPSVALRETAALLQVDSELTPFPRAMIGRKMADQ